MALPSEQKGEREGRIAYGVMLRLIAVGLAFGVPQLLAVGLRWLIVTVTPMGDGTGLLAGWVELFFWSNPAGETWALLFLLVALLTVALDGLAVAWAVRRGAQRDEPWSLLALGLAGLLARGLSYGASMGLSMQLGRTGGPESMAAFAIASNIAGMVQNLLFWALAVGTLVYVLAAALRRRGDSNRDGPYREPAQIVT